MIRAYARQAERTVNGMTKEEACRRFQERILHTARKVYAQVRDDAGVGLDDLVSFGVLGLLEAFERFQEGRGIDFTGFAEYRIRGAMLDALRTMDTFTRRRRDTARKLKAAREKATATVGREPTPSEVAKAMNASMEEYWLALDIATPVSLVSMDEATDHDGYLRSAFTGATLPEGPTAIFAEEARGVLRDAIAALPERERQMVVLYYGRDLNLAEIGEVLGVTPSRVCQVLSLARGKLKSALSQFFDLEALDAVREVG
jgi:RNA polymerase sigma factor for flagellar operon FliA